MFLECTGYKMPDKPFEVIVNLTNGAEKLNFQTETSGSRMLRGFDIGDGNLNISLYRHGSEYRASAYCGNSDFNFEVEVEIRKDFVNSDWKAAILTFAVNGEQKYCSKARLPKNFNGSVAVEVAYNSVSLLAGTGYTLNEVYSTVIETEKISECIGGMRNLDFREVK